ncbi:hypothetical protein Q31a_13830 [Aureliella helgolandensis]|uniref:Uncharacterized protein n=1 Tax=Aureliella helgolandensis TaxID=2527968 RepID=A0A518G3C0_9BACT|nr:hypothetical protein Q31a_13830 [Aureliella helgolandensis]
MVQFRLVDLHCLTFVSAIAAFSLQQRNFLLMHVIAIVAAFWIFADRRFRSKLPAVATLAGSELLLGIGVSRIAFGLEELPLLTETMVALAFSFGFPGALTLLRKAPCPLEASLVKLFFICLAFCTTALCVLFLADGS